MRTLADKALIPDDAEADKTCHDGKGQESHNLDKTKPKLALTELIDMKKVQHRDEQTEEYRPPKLTDFGYKVVHDDACGYHLRRDVTDPCNPVRPANATGPCGRNMLLRIGDERSGNRLFHRKLCQAEHDGKHDDPA